MSKSVNTDSQKIAEVLSRWTEDVLVKEHLQKEMESGRRLTIYLGTDPTGGDLHLGHAVIHRKLRDFQELGHKVILLVGDFTVLVGDHSDKDDQRIETNRQKIEENMKTYKEQFAKTVDMDDVEIRYNSEWLSELNFNDLIGIAKIFTLQQMSERDAFQKRVKAGKPVGFDELLYPLMQGYDAYALKTDIQIGGTDQLFNLQAGRKVMEAFGTKPQDIITMKLLVGNDGRKMGKSLQNYIAINSSSKDKFFGIMGIIDDIIVDYATSLTRWPLEKIAKIDQDIKSGKLNPMEAKLELAHEITRFFHGDKEASEARDRFKKEVQNKETPDDILEISLSKPMSVVEYLAKYHVSSKSEARRVIEQGGVEVNGVKVTDLTFSIPSEKNTVVRSGKKYSRLV